MARLPGLSDSAATNPNSLNYKPTTTAIGKPWHSLAFTVQLAKRFARHPIKIYSDNQLSYLTYF